MTLAPQPQPEPTPEPGRGSTWVVPGAEVHGLPRYIAAIRSGLWIIVAALVACVLVAALYLAQANKVFEGTSDLLITPQNLTVPVPGIIVQSSDPTRDVETAARLVESPSVARRVQRRLRLPGTSSDVLKRVNVQPVANSNIVTVTAKGPTPRAAAVLANAFGLEFVIDRTERLHSTLDQQIRGLRAQV